MNRDIIIEAEEIIQTGMKKEQLLEFIELVSDRNISCNGVIEMAKELSRY
ncbi:hypothetical protein NEAUS03_0717 [Nematocida ausubeli]|nr:hypothetical protein NEAUS03_0717 [Nematocida ausubeli]